MSIVRLLLAVTLLAAAPLPADRFAYDASAPLDVRVDAQRAVSGVKILDLTFASAAGRHVHAEMDVPANASHRGAILFVHWLGDPKTTNLSEFRDDALRMAKAGCVTLSVDAMWAKPQWFEKGRSVDTDYRASIDQVIDLRRALDLLLSQPGVDRARVAYVGHDFGAMYGAVLSGIDPRPRYYVLMAGTPSFSEWYLLGDHPADTTAYRQAMSQLDPPLYLAKSSARAYLFQFASRDRYIKPDRALEFFAASPAPKTMSVYVTNHALEVPQAHTDRITWLLSKLQVR
jgi:dienelactone hydrolase